MPTENKGRIHVVSYLSGVNPITSINNRFLFKTIYPQDIVIVSFILVSVSMVSIIHSHEGNKITPSGLRKPQPQLLAQFLSSLKQLL